MLDKKQETYKIPHPRKPIDQIQVFSQQPRFLEDATGTWVTAVHVLVWFKSLLVLE